MATRKDRREISIGDGNDSDRFLLRLYIAGPTTTSTRAIVNVRNICEAHLKDRYDLEVIDLSVDPKGGERDHIISLPTLVKVHPLPLKRFIGDLSNTDRVLTGLDIRGIPLG